MPKAEVGSTKYIANKMKAKGLQRLRWYCQICEKQCRDENGFKQHTMSEGHVRAMLVVGEDPRRAINDFSTQFQRDFLRLLRTAHGEKKVHLNNFYQEYIRDKEHVHMNATKWPSLTEFAKYLGREGICRVEEGERGIEVQWIDDSPEAVRRREDIKRKEKLAKGDEDLEARLLERQIKAAREEAERNRRLEDEKKPKTDAAEISSEPVKVSLSLGGAMLPKPRESTHKETDTDAPIEITTFSTSDRPITPHASLEPVKGDDADDETEVQTQIPAQTAAPKLSMSLGGKPKPVNPLMAKKKNPLSKKTENIAPEPEKKMSNAERIMREEMERKRLAEQRGYGGGAKRPRFA